MDTENQASIANSSEEVQAAAILTPPAPETTPAEPEMPEVGNIEDIKEQAQSIIDKANRQAEEILAIARADAGKIADAAATKLAVDREHTLDEARETGYDEGHAKGYAEGKQKAQALVDDAEVLKVQTQREREDALARFEPEIARLIADVVRKIGDGAVRANQGMIITLIKQGLSQSSFTGEITLRVSADDYEQAITRKDEIMTFVEGGASLEIIKDHSLGAGDCLIETPFGVVDSSLGMQLDQIKQDLAQILAQ